MHSGAHHGDILNRFGHIVSTLYLGLTVYIAPSTAACNEVSHMHCCATAQHIERKISYYIWYFLGLGTRAASQDIKYVLAFVE